MIEQNQGVYKKEEWKRRFNRFDEKRDASGNLLLGSTYV